MKRHKKIVFTSLSLLFACFLPSISSAGNLKKIYVNVSKEGQQAQVGDIPTNYDKIEANISNYSYNYIGGAPGTLYGGIVKDKEGAMFDGVNDVVRIPNSSSLQITGDLTLEAWVYPTDIAKGRQAIIFKTYNNEYEMIQEPSGTISFYHGDGAWEEIQEPVGMLVEQNKWNHVAIARRMSDKTIHFYLNGKLVGTDSFVKIPVASNNTVDIGRRIDHYFYNGKIREARIWNIFRDEAQITKDMNTFLGYTPGLVGYWRFVKE